MKRSEEPIQFQTTSLTEAYTSVEQVAVGLGNALSTMNAMAWPLLFMVNGGGVMASVTLTATLSIWFRHWKAWTMGKR